MEGLSYRKAIKTNSYHEELREIVLNTGGTHSTLQDIKVAEKAGGYSYKNNNRSRCIYWRSHQDILDLSEISWTTLYQNNIRYKFTDSPVIDVNIVEQGKHVVLLVSTVCSLHRICFPHPDSVADGSENFRTGTFSIFKDANAASARDPSSFYVIDNLGPSNNPIPHAAASFLSLNGEEAYFALACQNVLMLYTMNCSTGHTIGHQLKEHHIMPRLFSNMKGALTGKTDTSDSDHANSLVFTCINNQILLLALYRNDYLRVWSTIIMQIVCAINCVREGSEQRMQGPQSNALRKINDTSFCAFLSHSSGSEFVCLQLQINTRNTLNLQRRKIISAPELDLTDFEVDKSKIWGLWRNAEGEFSVSNFSLVPGMDMNWVSIDMDPPPQYHFCLVALYSAPTMVKGI